jgi:hypothetical protein
LPENVKRRVISSKKATLSNRIETVGGDFQKDDLPGGFDVVLLANFMSVAEENDNKKLLADIFKKLPSGGACILSGLYGRFTTRAADGGFVLSRRYMLERARTWNEAKAFIPNGCEKPDFKTSNAGLISNRPECFTV